MRFRQVSYISLQIDGKHVQIGSLGTTKKLLIKNIKSMKGDKLMQFFRNETP